jgi:hypothetical protein
MGPISPVRSHVFRFRLFAVFAVVFVVITTPDVAGKAPPFFLVFRGLVTVRRGEIRFQEFAVLHDVEQGKARFDTAWSSPESVLTALSKRFPEEEIRVRYADEDMGCNCGEYTMKNGEFLKSDFAPSYRDQTPEDKEKWRRFACDVRGRDYDEYYGEDGE